MTTKTDEPKEKEKETGMDDSETIDQKAADEAAENIDEDKDSSAKQDADSEKADTAAEPESDDNDKKDKEKQQEEDLNTRYLRLMADFQNFKKRADKQRSETMAYANEEIVSQLLDVMDNFERALQQEEEEDPDDNFRKGMQLIFDQMKTVLERTGVEEIKAVGESFDPNYHNAVLMVDSEEFESGTISEVLQKGYTLKGKVIRAAMVKVVN